MKQISLAAAGDFELKSRIRAKVKHPFRVLKRQFGFTKVRYRGLAKNMAQLAEQFAESAKLEAEIRKNLAGLGY